MDNNKYVIAMYDIRGIQNYIFKTTKLKDAIGASAIVEDIIEDAILEATKNVSQNSQYSGISCNFKYDCESLSKCKFPQYEDNKYDIQVLYIGGGNGVVLYSSKTLCVDMNKSMSMYVLEHTYSLQLAVAYVEKTDNYSHDYNELYKELAIVKSNMEESKPLSLLPIMENEKKTGNPISDKFLYDERGKKQYLSTESWLKKDSEQRKRNSVNTKLKIFDSYAEKKGQDSTIAVVHMDGNNMGLRIRALLENKRTYSEAVTEMRKISSSITNSYKSVYEKMETLFNRAYRQFMLSVLVAGDDITYVCTGKVALASVEYFAREISKRTMNGLDDNDSVERYGFTICAGVAFINSHFPFSVGYEVAEACCESAKEKAKASCHLYKNGKVGNWVDFQMCKNVYARELDEVRVAEYYTSSGENLILRPYELRLGKMKLNSDELEHYEHLIRNIEAFNFDENSEGKEQTVKENKAIPRSFAKKLRNTYPLGRVSVEQFSNFLKSRDYRMPDGTNNMYQDNTNKALWYDALELLDDYIPLSAIENQLED